MYIFDDHIPQTKEEFVSADISDNIGTEGRGSL